MFVDEKTQGEQQPVKVGTLKLSTAIRIGATKRPQCRQSLYRAGATCALGAAFEARMGRTYNGDQDSWILHEVLPEAFTQFNYNALGKDIGQRNDSGCTRESIADWLEAQGY